MSTFDVRRLEQVAEGTVKFFKLLENGRCPFDEFCETIQREGNLNGYLRQIFLIMDRVATERPISEGMIRPLKGGIKNEFEFRKGPLRVYFIKDPQGHIVISGGKKTAQKKDIPVFQGINKRFTDYKDGN